MSQIYRRLDQQQEENRTSFEDINTRMDHMDDQLSFLCFSNQMANEQMLFPYQNTSTQFKEMVMQGIPVTMANLALHRQKEEEMNQERMRLDQILQEAAAQQARETNKGKAREVVPDSEEEFISSESEEWKNEERKLAEQETKFGSKSEKEFHAYAWKRMHMGASYDPIHA
ncbi:hypothetical protein PIB30_079167 [Stylosanthes scabra]|uniref:Uncharacterized protein n=1 Tax=Stylosanthes scabra TaxID=79078 RepID=A0ABU6RRD2_9FABA|nr:hypothetical protein [Stylosanthes scabra]